MAQVEQASIVKDWDVDYLVAVGEKVTLIHPLRIWQYLDETMSWRGCFRTPKEGEWVKEKQILPVGSEGEVLELLGFDRYRIRFESGVIVHGVLRHDLEFIPSMFYRLEEEQ